MPCSNAAMVNSFFHAIGRFIMRPEVIVDTVSVRTREVLHDFAIACLLALGIGTGVGLGAAGIVSLLALANG